MWILARLATFLAVYVYRLIFRRLGVTRRAAYARAEIAIKTRKRKGHVTKLFYGVAHADAPDFQLTEEGAWDRWFKLLGLAVEFQSGDASFDARLYVACDHPALAGLLRRDASARRAALRLFDHGARRVFADGAHVWVESSKSTDPTDAEVEALEAFRAALASIGRSRLERLRDPFLWKAAAVEAFVWSLAFYGAPGFLELLVERNTRYLAPGALFARGLLVALGVYAALLTALALWLRGSSRGHRVLAESALLLAVGVPISSVQLVADANGAFDESAAVVLEPEIAGRRVERHGRRRSRRTYHLELRSTATWEYDVNRSIEVDRELYERAQGARRVAIRVRRGALGVPWIEAIEPL